MAGMVKVYFKNKIQLDRLTFPERDMLQLGQIAANGLRDQVQKGVNPKGKPLPPLNPGYAEWKAKHGKNPIRDLTSSGAMMRSFQARFVTANKVRATFAGSLQGLKVGVNAAGGRIVKKQLIYGPFERKYTFRNPKAAAGAGTRKYNLREERIKRKEKVHNQIWFIGFDPSARRGILDRADSIFKAKVDKLVQNGNAGLWTGERGL